MTADPGAMQRWRKEFDRLDWCPWPGPAPLDESQHHLLIGRVDDRRRFEAVLKEANKRLILLHAPSGAGKSSLLEAGIKRDLRRKGATIHTVNKWGGIGGLDAERFLASKLRLSGERPFERFGELRGSGVLILDQFEELVRYSPTATSQLFEQILAINRLYKTKVIVSFRSEYLHEFAALENGAVGYSVASMPISEVEDRFAPAVVKSGNRNKRRPVEADDGDQCDGADVPDPIDPDVAQWLADQWTRAREQVTGADAVIGDDPFARVGLLHLQAMLYSLYFAAERQPLTTTKVIEVLEKWEEASPGTFNVAPWIVPASITLDGFRRALARAVEHKLDHCDEAGRTDNLVDSQLRRGTRWMVERTVEHLSSAGYKLIRSASELALLALGSDHDQLRREQKKRAVMDPGEEALLKVLLAAGLVGDGSDDEVGAPVVGAGAEELSDATTDEGHGEPSVVGAEAAAAVDLIAADRHQIAEKADELAPGAGWCALLAAPGSQPFENDEFEVTSGHLFGATPADVLIEELRRFAFALAWLEAGDLVRVATPLAGQPMVSLIHDGFGTALNGWAEEARSDPEGVLSALTAPRGFTFAWADRGVGLLRAERKAEDRPGLWSGTHRVLSNLRWQSGTVEATRLQHIAFLNCDFQGLLFRGCTFEGVVFVNCLLDGAVFSDCTITGELPFLDRYDLWSPEDPNFLVPLDEDPTPLFRRYLGAGFDGAAQTEAGSDQPQMFCDLPGAAAVPFDGEDSWPDGKPRAYELRRTPQEPDAMGSPESEPQQGRLCVDLVGGGVAIYGGRVSNLVVRHCTFAPTSAMAVRHATGSGLDLVEVRGEPLVVPAGAEASGEDPVQQAKEGSAVDEAAVLPPSRLEIFGSAVRHLTISTSDDERGAIDLRVVQAMLPQTYVGTGLTGKVEALDSSLMQVWNASPPDAAGEGVDFSAISSLVHGALDIRMDEDSVPLPRDTDEVPAPPATRQIEQAAVFPIGGEALPKRLARMDYRRNPARFRAKAQAAARRKQEREGPAES